MRFTLILETELRKKPIDVPMGSLDFTAKVNGS